VQRTQSVGVGQGRGVAVSTWSSVTVPVIVTPPVGASLTLATAAVGPLVSLSNTPWPSV
jgi:hypothetical protein